MKNFYKSAVFLRSFMVFKLLIIIKTMQCFYSFSEKIMSFSNTSTPEGNVPLTEINPSIEPGSDFNERYIGILINFSASCC